MKSLLITLCLAGGWLASCSVALSRLHPRASNQLSRYPNPKYYNEAAAGPHYDRRFASYTLEDAAQRDSIRVLMQTCLATFRDLGVQPWLMHGTLLGWWWGGKVLPWDFDADIQVSEWDMSFLAAYYNMTVYYYQYDAIPKGRSFLLDINPHSRYRESDDQLNVIDARYIDMESGLYIDITAARYGIDSDKGEGMLYEKSGHLFRDTYLYPLRDTTFEGVPAKIPFRYREMLVSEYSEKALTNTQFMDHHFDDEKMEWIPDYP